MVHHQVWNCQYIESSARGKNAYEFNLFLLEFNTAFGIEYAVEYVVECAPPWNVQQWNDCATMKYAIMEHLTILLSDMLELSGS